MELNAAIEKIRKYLDGGSSVSIVVDVPDMPCLNVLRNVFNTGSNKFVDAGEYCSDDSLPQTDKLLNENDSILLFCEHFVNFFNFFRSYIGYIICI